MALPRAAAFDYVTEVPDHDTSTEPWRMRLREPVERRGDQLADARLVGHSPVLTIADSGRANDGRPPHAPRILDVARSKLTLVASARTDAAAAQASFFVARQLVSVLRPRDSLHMVRNDTGELGISVIRDGTCVAAAGAVSEVPLGTKVRARLPWDQLNAAEMPFRERDPSFEFPDVPLEVTVDGETNVMFRGPRRLGEYEIFVFQPYSRGMPGMSECVGLSHINLCEVGAANGTAQLLQSYNIEIVEW